MRHPNAIPFEHLYPVLDVAREFLRLAAALITVNGLAVLAWLCFGP